MMTDESQRPANRSWPRKFSDAGRGVKVAVCGEASFLFHLLVTAIVVIAGAVLGISRIEWCLIVLCVAIVLAAEMFNTAIERIARAVTDEENRDIRDALDIASGAVLVIAAGAATVGMFVLGVHCWIRVFG